MRNNLKRQISGWCVGIGLGAMAVGKEAYCPECLGILYKTDELILFLSEFR